LTRLLIFGSNEILKHAFAHGRTGSKETMKAASVKATSRASRAR
jgi:hypothetical protein